MLRVLASSTQLNIAPTLSTISWSQLLPMWMRKHRFVFVEGWRVGSNGDFVVAERGAVPSAKLPAGIFEGPLDIAILQQLGLTARQLSANRIALYPSSITCTGSEPECFEGIAYGRDILRRIPTKRGEKSNRYIWQPEDVRLSPGPINLQVFEASPEWTVLATARLDDYEEKYPVVIGNGRIVLMGLPLFDLVIRKHHAYPHSSGAIRWKSVALKRRAA